MSTVPITVHGAQLLKDELQRLKHVERPAVINAIAEARAQGKLSAAQIIDPKLLDADGRVVFASTVTLEDLESGDKVTYQIVGDDEADLKLSKISISSPIARALIGKYAGDGVEVQAPGGVREYEVIEVKYI